MSSNKGYLSAEYAASFSEYGRPRLLEKSGGYILRRQIAESGLKDAMGSYPFFCCTNWSELGEDLLTLGTELVTVSIVTDPFGVFDVVELRAIFPDTFSLYKEHFVVDFSRNWRDSISKHHLRNIKKGSAGVHVELCTKPVDHLDDWCKLYQNLIERHQIKGMTTFSRSAFEKQLCVPGLEGFRAVVDGQTVGMTLWIAQGEDGYYHLGAYNDLGYKKHAAYALFDTALNHYAARGVVRLGLGAGAGTIADRSDGLSRFKAGWASCTRPVYLCGRVLDRDRYHNLSERLKQTSYFPAYRQGEFGGVREGLLIDETPDRAVKEVFLSPRLPATKPNLPSIPVARPLLPELGAVAGYIAEIDRSRIYSNFGPLNHRLRQRFARFFGVPETCIVTVSNATIGISLALMVTRRPERPYCLFPSWNFPAGPHAAVQAGLIPFFVDVDRDSGALDLASAADAVRRLNGAVGAMVVVMPFGAPMDVAPYRAFASGHDLNLVIDAAAAIDTVTPCENLAVVSLHATKALGVGEGGLVISTDPAPIAKVLRASNFGFAPGRSVEVAALNGKMSEYHAAIGHAALDEWPWRRQQWLAVAQAYRRHIGPRARLQQGWGETWISSTCVVDLLDADAEATARHLLARGCETRRWWDACHRQPAFAQVHRTELSVTEQLTHAILGLPFFPDLTEEMVVRVCAELNDALNSARPRTGLLSGPISEQTEVREFVEVATHSPARSR